MAKQGDFGGVPQSQFDLYVNYYTNPVTGGPLMANGQAARAMAALAKEEHAAANATGAADIIAVVMKCIDLQNLHLDITSAGLGAADGKGNFPKVDAFINLLGDLEKLWG